MNAILTMSQVRDRLGMAGKSNRLVQRRLQAVAEERASDFALFRVGKAWATTEADLRALLPELYAHEDAEAAALTARVAVLTRKVEALENHLYRLTRKEAAA